MLFFDFRPEEELLIHCARTRLGAGQRQRIGELVQRGLDWEHLHGLARYHATLPLLYLHLEREQADSVPTAALAALRDDYRAGAWRSLMQVGELLELLKLFDSAGILALPYKGPVLAAALYGHVNLRQSLDLDILLPRGQVERAASLLEDRGYRPEANLRDALDGVQHAHGYYHPEKQIYVDVHWTITRTYYPFPLAFDELWQARQTLFIGDRAVPGLVPELLLPILAVHGGKHCWERLSWIVDVAELLQRNSALDWDQIETYSRKTRSRRMLNLALFLAHHLLEAPLPGPLAERLQADHAISALARDVYRQLLAPQSQGLMSQIEADGFRIRLRESARDKASYIHNVLRRRTRLNSHDEELFPLPTTLHFLYYLIRPLRLLRYYGLRPLYHTIKESFR